MIRVDGLTAWRERLATAGAEEAMARALAAEAARVAEAVRAGLSDPPGSGGHERPWVQSGALRESVGVTADGLTAVVGSSDPAAAPQEMGTSRMAARPFLAPVAAAMGDGVGRAIGAAVAQCLRADQSAVD